VDGLNGAIQTQLRAQFGQRQIGLFGQQSPQTAPVLRQQLRFASREAMPRGDVSRFPPLMQQLRDQAERDAEALGQIGSGSFLPVVGADDPLPQVKGDGGHALENGKNRPQMQP